MKGDNLFLLALCCQTVESFCKHTYNKDVENGLNLKTKDTNWKCQCQGYLRTFAQHDGKSSSYGCGDSGFCRGSTSDVYNSHKYGFQ